MGGIRLSRGKMRAMSNNGTAHVAAAFEAPRPLKAAELSSQQRNALVDDLVATVNNHARVLGEMRGRIEALTTQVETHNKNLDALARSCAMNSGQHQMFGNYIDDSLN